MKHYTTLIKLKQRELDQLQKQMAELRKQQAAFEDEKASLHTSLEEEKTLAASMTGMGGFFGNYSQSIKEKIEQIAKQIAVIETQQKLLTEKIRMAFGEQKKFEIAMERILRDANYTLSRKEQQLMDEIAGRMHASS